MNHPKWSGITVAGIKKLREKKWSYQMIGDHYGVSRQRVHQVLTGYRQKWGVIQENQKQPRYTRWDREETPMKVCKNCNEEFELKPPSRTAVQYCSTKCYKAMMVRIGSFYATKEQASLARKEKHREAVRRYRSKRNAIDRKRRTA